MRAIRRHHKSRMKAKARRLYPACKRPERYADNLTACSCPMCGHRRKWRGPTMQERRRVQLKAHLDGGIDWWWQYRAAEER